MPSTNQQKAKIALIICSTRTPLIGPDVAKHIKEVIETDTERSADISLVDLVDFKLPVYDESVVPFEVPTLASFHHKHSQRWSDEISRFAAYILVIPEYNYGMTGATKNAIDYLKNEWDGKPATIVSYGITDGKIASEQVKTSLEGVGLRVCPTRPQLVFSKSGETPDVFAAMKEGRLGENSWKDWNDDKQTILRAYGEMLDALGVSHTTQ